MSPNSWRDELRAGGPEAKSIVFIWDNFGPPLIDRTEAAVAGLAPLRVVGIELRQRSTEYAWQTEEQVRFEKVNLPREDMAWPMRAFAIVRAVLKVRPAAVFTCHYERPEILSAAIIMRLLGLPVFVMIDSKFDDYQRFLWREVLKRFFLLPYNGAIVGSKRSAGYLRFLGFKPDRLTPGYDAISVDRIRRLSRTVPAPEGAAFNSRHFTVVARLTPKKNISTAIRAFAQLRAEGSSRYLVICGAGFLDAELRAEVAALGIRAFVRFEGFVQTDDVARILGSTLALIQPSVEEQFGLVIAEAIAMGLPILVSENCGARDSLVRTAVNGFVFEPDNIPGLAALMKQIDRDPALWRRMAEASLAIAPQADTPVFVDSVRRLCGLRVNRTPRRLAPIALFAYRRAGHLERCLDALEQCPEFEASQVFVFVDGPRNDTEAGAVQAVRDLLERRRRPNMTIVARDTNRGLANSIIAEVTALVDQHGRVIVIEDDLILERAALSWLNQALDFYEDDARVMQISAHQFRTPQFDHMLTGTFQRFTTTWGWATWKRAWDTFDPEAEGWQAIATPGTARTEFDAGGAYPFSEMLVKQMCGELDSWGIRWSWSMHKARGLALMPPRSMVRNAGMDETATHNSIGSLKLLASGPQPRLWKAEHPPQMPSVVAVDPYEQTVFRRGLRRTGAKRNAAIKAVLSALGIHISSARVHDRIRRVIVVAQMPPPITGLARVNECMVATLGRANLLFETINAAPAGGSRGLPKAADRVGRTLKAAYCLVRPVYRRATTLYLSCDGGWGQLYNLAVIMAARAGRFELWLHHHSFAYVSRRSGLTAALLRACPKGTTHIFLCEQMAAGFRSVYRAEWDGGHHLSRIVSNAFTVDRPDPDKRPEGSLVIGHLSNLTAEKGSVRFIDLFRRLVASGLPVRAEMAGPIQDAATTFAIRSVEADHPNAFKWHGPVSGAAKRTFYDSLDAFIFPTDYVNEAQPIVLLEALAHGGAVLSTNRGCIACDHASSPGLITETEDFDEAAYAWLSTLSVDERKALPQAARNAFETARRISEQQLADIIKEIASGPAQEK